MIKLLSICYCILILTMPALADCQGCCSHHGGVVCFNGVVLCGDRTPLSDTCILKGCSSCPRGGGGSNTTQVFDAPTFIKPEHIYWDDSDDLICLLPDPNSDGRDTLGTGSWGYNISFFKDCEVISGFDAMEIRDESWPLVLKITDDNLPDEFTIHIRRIDENGELSSSIVLQSPARKIIEITDTHSYTRWLPHFPKYGGGFTSRLKIYNRNTSTTNQLRLVAFDQNGQYLTDRMVPIAKDSSEDIPISGYIGKFGSYFDRISHIGLVDSNGLTKVYQQYYSEASGYSAWIPEIDITEGDTTGQAFTIQQRSNETTADGLAILNLTSRETVGVRISLKNKTSEVVPPKDVGSIEPGAKLLVVPSDLFPITENGYYQIETEDPNQRIQVMGFSFSGNAFFSPLAINKLR